MFSVLEGFGSDFHYSRLYAIHRKFATTKKIVSRLWTSYFSNAWRPVLFLSVDVTWLVFIFPACYFSKPGSSIPYSRLCEYGSDPIRIRIRSSGVFCDIFLPNGLWGGAWLSVAIARYQQSPFSFLWSLSLFKVSTVGRVPLRAAAPPLPSFLCIPARPNLTPSHPDSTFFSKR